MLRLASLVVAVLAAACGGNSISGASPAAATPANGGPAVPVPSGEMSGRIENSDTAVDLVTYNQAVNVGKIVAALHDTYAGGSGTCGGDFTGEAGKECVIDVVGVGDSASVSVYTDGRRALVTSGDCH